MVTSGSSAGWRKTALRGMWALLLAAAILLWGRFSGQWLIVDEPEKSDVIVVLAGDVADQRYYRGLQLLRSGYGETMLVDVEDRVKFGESAGDAAERFIRATAGEVQERVRVCRVEELSTAGEAKAVRVCVEPLHPRRLLLVTNDFHSRRALSVFNRRLPQYSWSIAAVADKEYYGVQWWRRRAWAKSYLVEWEKTAWWLAVDRW